MLVNNNGNKENKRIRKRRHVIKRNIGESEIKESTEEK